MAQRRSAGPLAPVKRRMSRCIQNLMARRRWACFALDRRPARQFGQPRLGTRNPGGHAVPALRADLVNRNTQPRLVILPQEIGRPRIAPQRRLFQRQAGLGRSGGECVPQQSLGVGNRSHLRRRKPRPGDRTRPFRRGGGHSRGRRNGGREGCRRARRDGYRRRSQRQRRLTRFRRPYPAAQPGTQRQYPCPGPSANPAPRPPAATPRRPRLRRQGRGCRQRRGCGKGRIGAIARGERIGRFIRRRMAVGRKRPDLDVQDAGPKQTGIHLRATVARGLEQTPLGEMVHKARNPARQLVQHPDRIRCEGQGLGKVVATGRYQTVAQIGRRLVPVQRRQTQPISQDRIEPRQGPLPGRSNQHEMAQRARMMTVMEAHQLLNQRVGPGRQVIEDHQKLGPGRGKAGRDRRETRNVVPGGRRGCDDPQAAASLQPGGQRPGKRRLAAARRSLDQAGLPLQRDRVDQRLQQGLVPARRKQRLGRGRAAKGAAEFDGKRGLGPHHEPPETT